MIFRWTKRTAEKPLLAGEVFCLVIRARAATRWSWDCAEIFPETPIPAPTPKRGDIIVRISAVASFPFFLFASRLQT